MNSISSPAIGDIPLNKLTTRDLQKLYNDLQSNGQAAKGTEKGETRTEQFHCARYPHDAAQRP
ncbi:MAG: hypothetical protein ACLSHJ_11015 [Oscillospiraceae bacterium]